MNNSIELKNLSEIYKDYDVFIIDLWGVVHNGEKIFNGIYKVLEEIKLINKKIFFMTNAPRRSKVIEEQLSAFGLNRDLYECVISSGEITWQALKKKSYKFCYIIGPERDYHLIEGLNYEVIKDYENVEIIINLSTRRIGLDDGEKNEWLMYKKENRDEENRFFLDDYLKLIKFYSNKIKKTRFYSLGRLQKDYCNSGESRYDTNDIEGRSVNYCRYLEDKLLK